MLEYLQSNGFISFPAKIQEQLKLQENLKFDLYDRTILTKYYFYLNGFIRCYAYGSISNPGSIKEVFVRWFDKHLWLWNKKYYFELILHVIVRFPIKVINLFKKLVIRK